MSLDVDALFGSSSTLARLPVFLALFLLVRGLPALLFSRQLPRSELLPLALLSATALPVIVAVTQIALRTDRIRPANAAALVGAGVLSVLVFPLVAFALRQRSAGQGRVATVETNPASDTSRG